MRNSVVNKIVRKSESYVTILKSLPGINKGNVYLNIAGIKRHHRVILSLSHALSLYLCLIHISTMTAVKLTNSVLLNPPPEIIRALPFFFMDIFKGRILQKQQFSAWHVFKAFDFSCKFPN